MDQRLTYLRKHQIPELIDSLVSKMVSQLPDNPKQFLVEQLTPQFESKFPVSSSYPFTPSACTGNSVVAGILSKEMYGRLRERRTLSGATLEDCIVDSVEEAMTFFGTDVRSECPPFASDEECYRIFNALFEPYIAGVHQPSSVKRSSALDDCPHDFQLGGRQLPPLPSPYFVSAVVRVRRNIMGYRFASKWSRSERRDLLNFVVSHATECSSFEGGEYIPATLTANSEVPDEFLPHKSMYCSTARREWPDGRGSFISSDKISAIVVGNNEEHVDFVATATDGDFVKAFERVIDDVNSFGALCDKYGKPYLIVPDTQAYATCNPDFVGNAMTIEVMFSVPNLAAQENWSGLLKAHGLVTHTQTTQQRRASKMIAATLLRNQSTIGSTEADTLLAAYGSLCKLVQLEQNIESGQAIHS